MLPLIEKPLLYHVGTMDPTQSDPHSYEGHLLSVSEDPDAWRRIARLSGDEWSLACPNAWFVDVHRCREDKETWNAFLFWADSKGLVEFVDCHVVRWYDEELERDMNMMFANREALEREYDEEELEDGHLTVEVEKNVPRLTEKGMQKYDLTRSDYAWDVDFAFPDWVRAKFASNDARIKGLWWADIDSPETLSAPRGGIFPEKVELFDLRNLTNSAAPGMR